MMPSWAGPKRPVAPQSPRFAGKMTPADYEYLRLYQADLAIARKIQPALNEGSCQTLVEEWRSGSRDRDECRTKLIYGFMPLVVNIARPRAGEGVELSDLIQKGNDKIIELLPSADAPPTETSFFRFATRSVSNLYRDCFRVEHLPQRRNAISTSSVTLGSPELPPDQLAQSTEGENRIEAAIKQLSKDDARIIRAVIAGEDSGDELAALLGIKASAAHMRKSRAIRRLAVILKPDADNSDTEAMVVKKVAKKPRQPRKAKASKPAEPLEQSTLALVTDTPLPPLLNAFLHTIPIVLAPTAGVPSQSEVELPVPVATDDGDNDPVTLRLTLPLPHSRPRKPCPITAPGGLLSVIV